MDQTPRKIGPAEVAVADGELPCVTCGKPNCPVLIVHRIEDTLTLYPVCGAHLPDDGAALLTLRRGASIAVFLT